MTIPEGCRALFESSPELLTTQASNCNQVGTWTKLFFATYEDNKELFCACVESVFCDRAFSLGHRLNIFSIYSEENCKEPFCVCVWSVSRTAHSVLRWWMGRLCWQAPRTVAQWSWWVASTHTAMATGTTFPSWKTVSCWLRFDFPFPFFWTEICV